MVASHASCAFSFGASERLEGWDGQEAPGKHLDLGWVRGLCWVKPEVSGWRSASPDTGLGRPSMCSPPLSQNKTMPGSRCPGRWYFSHSRNLGQGAASNREACGSFSSSLWNWERGQGSQEQKEEKGESSRGRWGGCRQGAWSSCPCLPQELGEQLAVAHPGTPLNAFSQCIVRDLYFLGHTLGKCRNNLSLCIFVFQRNPNFSYHNFGPGIPVSSHLSGVLSSLPVYIKTHQNLFVNDWQALCE